MIYTLLEPDHELLKHPLPEITADTEPEDRVELTNNMSETMKHYGGIGLSANQVGLAIRMFVFGDKENFIPCFNPKILEYGGPEMPIEEGCLTYPGLFVKIYRPDWIVAQWEDEKRELHKENFTGLPSRIFQHEYDHMQGIDFRSRAGRISLDMAQRKVKRAQRKIKKMQE
tara:strand:- start:150 stop:662 length:513 start_codon:yes stop_codon:yes gene_type:complete